MKALITAVLVSLMAVAFAAAEDQADQSPDAPAPADAQSPATQPSAAASSREFPSPAELVKRMKTLEKKRAAMAKVAYFDLSRPVSEKPADFSLFGDDGSSTLRSLVERLRMARQDPDIKAVLITMGAESGVNYSQAQEIRNALAGVVKAGKPCFVYADSYDTPTYTLATGANHICMLEGGEIMIPGVGMEITFYKGLFDKLGVKADYVQIGEYKGADEEYTRTEASEELKGELNKLTDALYGQIVQGISSHRHLPSEQVKSLIDQTIITGDQAKERGFVDDLVDEDGLRPLLKKTLGRDIDLVADFGRPAREAPDITSPFGLLSLLMHRSETPTDKPAIAIIYAAGVITDGEGGGGLFEESGVASETMRKAFRAAARDPNIKAVVIRIDSPGGSALASEVMWQAARHCAQKKPVIVSVGGMAASGGYYLASAGDKIFADPSAIVGSIGVVGGKFVYKDLFDKLGIHTETFSKGSNAGLFNSDQPWSERQRTMVTHWMKDTYVQFTQRVMKMRGGKIKDIDKVARGRIFLAGQARELGMVDEIGGIDDALADAAKKGGLTEGGYDVRILPAPKTLGDYLTGNGADAATPIRPRIEIKDPVLQGLAPMLRGGLGRELQMIQLLQKRPVLLVAPFEVTIR
jgi:protease IV